jgi:hypothetical protein
MKRITLISVLILIIATSCTNTPKANYSQETILVGSQSVQLTFSSEQSVYEGTKALPTSLVIDNQSDQPIYLPWGTDPGYNLIIVGLDSTNRTFFGTNPPTQEEDITDYFSIQPGEEVTNGFPLPTMPEPGRYNVCAEIILIGKSNGNQTYDVEMSSLKPKICIEVLYK